MFLCWGAPLWLALGFGHAGGGGTLALVVGHAGQASLSVGGGLGWGGPPWEGPPQHQQQAALGHKASVRLRVRLGNSCIGNTS